MKDVCCLSLYNGVGRMSNVLLQSEYFSDLSVAPVICAARCAEGLDERGGRALDVSIHCTVHGVDKVSRNTLTSKQKAKE